MFELNSKRLRLIPLPLPQLKALIEGRYILESQLGLKHSNFSLNAPDSFLQELREALAQYNLPQLQQKPEDFPWNAHWLIVHAKDNTGIGGMGLSGPPNEAGTVMLGYFIDKKYEGRGLCSEALAALLQWIFSDRRVTQVLADTLTEGIASQRVLQKNGFKLMNRVPEGLRWQRLP